MAASGSGWMLARAGLEVWPEGAGCLPGREGRAGCMEWRGPVDNFVPEGTRVSSRVASRTRDASRR